VENRGLESGVWGQKGALNKNVRIYLKKKFWFKVKAAVIIKPEEYRVGISRI